MICKHKIKIWLGYQDTLTDYKLPLFTCMICHSTISVIDFKLKGFDILPLYYNTKLERRDNHTAFGQLDITERAITLMEHI